MAFSSRSLPSHIRQSSVSGNPSAQSTGQSSALLARVNEKKAELENLKELKELSAAVADRMEALQQKLATLSDGTEAIATVLGNWHSVLQAINMASAKIPLPQPVEEDEDEDGAEKAQIPLPQTLVRIPTEHAPALQAQAEIAMENEQDVSLTTP